MLSHAIRLATILLVGFSTVACADDETQSAQRTDQVAALQTRHREVSNADFSELLTDTRFATFKSVVNHPDPGLAKLVQIHKKMLKSQLDTRALTPREEMRAGIWLLPSGRRGVMLDTLNAVFEFYNAHGRLPDSGMELYPELSTSAGLEAFATLSDEDKLEKYFAGINPITGHWYQSFNSSQWAPGAIDFRVLEGEQIEALFGAPVMFGDPENMQDSGVDGKHSMHSGEEEPRELRKVEKLFQVKVWGENPATIIYETTMM